jgi:hypothetical protein
MRRGWKLGMQIFPYGTLSSSEFYRNFISVTVSYKTSNSLFLYFFNVAL